MTFRSVLVAGAGVTGVAAAKSLLRLGVQVTIDYRSTQGGEELAVAGATVVRDLDAPPPSVDLVVTSPGLPPLDPLLVAAAAGGIEVISEIELAWRIQPSPPPAWLALTGTDGKSTTVGMLESMLRAAGERAVATGNVGYPISDAVLVDPPYDVLAVELSSAQLHFSPSIAPVAAAILNVVPDHLDWHGSFDAYVADKARIYDHARYAIYNLDDPTSTRIAAAADHPIGFTLDPPKQGQLGVVDGVLVDLAFGAGHLAHAADIRPPGPHNTANALAAAALARSYGIGAQAIDEGLRAYVPAPHRNAFVATVAGVDYVNDSKATNAHAAGASLTSYPRVVWIAGGQLKGASVDELVAMNRDRLVGAVLLGVDRELIATAIARHAPDVPVVEVATGDDKAMVEAVTHAARMARPGDTVLLAPAAASRDMYASYGARGDAFEAAVRSLDAE